MVRGVDNLTVGTLKGREYIENVQKRAREEGVQKSIKLSVRTF